ncbi:hypothetical protein L509_0504 [Bordetella bronchiseptica M85/00/2]|nr:hypothetical protein L509_0504 [Bordetella bronchiseptica M85/00/2]
MLVDEKTISIHDLYTKVSNAFENVDEFMYALDVLYILNKVNVDFDLKTVTYAD